MCTRANWNVFCTRPFIYSTVYLHKRNTDWNQKEKKHLFNRLKCKVQGKQMKNKQLFILDLNKLIDLK